MQCNKRGMGLRGFITGALLIGATVAMGQEFDLSWHSMDGGGAMRSTGGDFELSGTVGQPDAGVMEGGAYLLTGGFWFEIVPADCNEDGGVNRFDYADFEACLTGPNGPSAVGSCRCFDIDRNKVVDMADFAELQALYSGDY